MDKSNRQRLYKQEINEITDILNTIRNSNGLSTDNFPKTLGNEEFTENYTCLKGETTGLPCLATFDTGEQYKYYKHPLAMFIINGSIQDKNTPVIPVTIEDSPKVFGDIAFSQEVCNFIKRNKQLLIDAANLDIDGADFVDGIIADREKQNRINNDQYSSVCEMSTLKPETTGLPVWIYVDDTQAFMRSGHSGSYRIKYQPKNGSKNPRDWLPIIIPSCKPVIKTNDKKLEKQVIEWAKLNMDLLLKIRDMQINISEFKNKMHKINNEKVIFDSELNNNVNI